MLQDLQPGDPQLIGSFRLRAVLGAGGMGRVFLGATADGELAAVKIVHAGLAADPVFRARFRREVEVARKVSGPFTAPVIDADLDGPMPWLATAYVAGPSLEAAVAEGGPMAPGAVLEMAARLAEGLAAIHAAGVVHRDLKPSNILLGPDGPRLIDFGVSRTFGDAALTDTGHMIGSPGYMSPEQAEGLPVGPPSDVFSLGAVLAFAATGQGPFAPGSTPALIYRVIHRPADLSRVPAEVRGLVERCLVKDPALRPAARDLAAATGARRAVPPTATEADRTVPVLVPPDLPLSLGVWERVPARAPVRPPRRRSRPPRRRSRPSWRRHWRSLSAAAAVAALLGAAAGLVLTATPDPAPAPAAQSLPQAAATATPLPATAAPLSPAHPRTSASARARKAIAAASSPVSSTRAGLVGTTPVADTTTPADEDASADPNPSPAATAPTAASSPHQSVSVSPTARPRPSASASPTPSPPPTPTSGGYGY